MGPETVKILGVLALLGHSAAVHFAERAPLNLTCNPNIDVFVLLNASSGVSSAEFNAISALAADTVHYSEAETYRTALVTYGAEVQLHWNLAGASREEAPTRDAILSNLQKQGGENNLGAALQFVMRVCLPLRRHDVPSLVVVATDGLPVDDTDRLHVMLAQFERMRIKIKVVGGVHTLYHDVATICGCIEHKHKIDEIDEIYNGTEINDAVQNEIDNSTKVDEIGALVQNEISNMLKSELSNVDQVNLQVKYNKAKYTNAANTEKDTHIANADNTEKGTNTTNADTTANANKAANADKTANSDKTANGTYTTHTTHITHTANTMCDCVEETHINVVKNYIAQTAEPLGCEQLTSNALCSAWSPWSACSAECGEGNRYREMHTVKQPKIGAKRCLTCGPKLGKTCAAMYGASPQREVCYGDNCVLQKNDAPDVSIFNAPDVNTFDEAHVNLTAFVDSKNRTYDNSKNRTDVKLNRTAFIDSNSPMNVDAKLTSLVAVKDPEEAEEESDPIISPIVLIFICCGMIMIMLALIMIYCIKYPASKKNQPITIDTVDSCEEVSLYAEVVATENENENDFWNE